MKGANEGNQSETGKISMIDMSQGQYLMLRKPVKPSIPPPPVKPKKKDDGS